MRVLLVSDVDAMTTGGFIHVSLEKELLENRGHTVDHFTCGHRFNGVWSYFSRFFNVKDYVRMKRTISNFKPDVIHVHGIHACLSPSPIVAAGKRTPVVMTLHDYHYVCPKVWMIYEDDEICQTGFGRRCLFSKCPPRKVVFYEWARWFKVWLHRRLLKKYVDVFISPSHGLAEWFSRSVGRDVNVIPNFRYIAAQYDYPVPEGKFILCVARLFSGKGVRYLIEAMPTICEKVPDARLIVAGDGPELKMLRQMARTMDVADKVRFAGWVEHDQISDLYREACVVVAPSIWVENFGSIAVEAISSGKPIVASNIGGFTDIVRDGQNGYLVEPRNVEDLADKIIRILNDPELAKSMSRNARECARQYGREIHAERIEALFAEILEGVNP